MKLPMKIRVGYRTIEIAYAKPDFKRDNMTELFKIDNDVYVRYWANYYRHHRKMIKIENKIE